MKSYHDQRGNLIPGVSVIEGILGNRRKTEKLLAVLDHFKMRIVTEAEIKNKRIDWIVPASW